MASPMQSINFRNIVQPILSEEFDGIYDQRKDEYKQVFKEVQGIPRNQHVAPFLNGFNNAPELPDGAQVEFDSGGTLYTKIFTYKQYGLAFALTRVLVEDAEHISIGTIYAKHLAASMIETKEINCANNLNRAFNSSYVGGDGVSLSNASHPLANGGVFSNILATPAALSQTSFENILIQIRGAVDANGKKINLAPQRLVVPTALVMQAAVLTGSALRTGAANNDINPTMGMLADPKPAVMSRLTSNTAWWVSADVPDGLQVVMRRKLEKTMEGDFQTDSMQYKTTERYDTGWVDPRTVFGTAGQ